MLVGWWTGEERDPEGGCGRDAVVWIWWGGTEGPLSLRNAVTSQLCLSIKPLDITDACLDSTTFPRKTHRTSCTFDSSLSSRVHNSRS